jgi:two-component system, OmpR family, phosphate regulon sensor histidine kinase PhoR
MNIDPILHLSVDGLKKRLAEKNQTLDLKLPEQFPPMLANPVQMRQLVDNLLDNAVKYTGADGTITVSGEVEDNQIILRFCDTGMGIPALDLPYIFDKFYRATNASGEMSGTGLGLAIVKSVIDNHEGRIWVDSIQNRGTTVTVVLPVMQQ